jgi:hypothetical protein
MKSIVLSSALALFAMTSLALAEPVKLTGAQMDQVTAGKITEETRNPAGKTPPGQQNNDNSNCQNCETVNVNPSGKAPPGQNK